MSILKKKEYKNLLIYWLSILIFLLITMIIIGGITRLTDSGLSITRWDLFSGILPPLTDADWTYHFSLYKEIPQYYLLNLDMNLNEFKVIFLWEYIHRMLGRLIGLFYILPLLYFIFKKAFSKEYEIKFLSIFLLILFQGFLGWYMVKSGLVNNVTVSHYRLSAHLFVAFVILSSLFWFFLNAITTKNKSFLFNNSGLSVLKIFIFLIFIQIILGAFVSGLDAGKIYQTWPLMNSSYFPDDINYNNLKNIIDFSNQSFVQFLHRNIAYLIFGFFLYIGFIIKHLRKENLYSYYYFLLFIVVLQILLGVFTLISNLNIFIASLHQISSILLIIISIGLYHRSIE
jgi:heme a synthase